MQWSDVAKLSRRPANLCRTNAVIFWPDRIGANDFLVQMAAQVSHKMAYPAKEDFVFLHKFSREEWEMRFLYSPNGSHREQRLYRLPPPLEWRINAVAQFYRDIRGQAIAAPAHRIRHRSLADRSLFGTEHDERIRQNAIHSRISSNWIRWQEFAQKMDVHASVWMAWPTWPPPFPTVHSLANYERCNFVANGDSRAARCRCAYGRTLNSQQIWPIGK